MSRNQNEESRNLLSNESVTSSHDVSNMDDDNFLFHNSNNLVTLQWKNIKVTTEAGRVLLDDVSGCAIPGEVVALMGASGAGKTTLLNTLLHRNLKGLKVEGEILVNGQNIMKSVTSVSAYVQQEDLFLGTLTVKEHLEIQARMRLHSGASKEEREKRVDDVMKEMMLEKSENSRIGVPGIRKGISGGEMKRLAFATEMLNNPPIIFCDEPTTGLDSHMSLQVIRTLEAMAAQKGKTIICTIHQPSSEVFEIFDKVVFLAQGKVAFHGAIDEAIHFFADCNHMVPDHTNPADYFIDTLAIKPSEAEKCKAVCRTVCETFSRSEYKKKVDDLMQKTISCRSMKPHVGANYKSLFCALFLRYLLDNIRNPAILKAKILQKVYMALFMGFLYFQLNKDQDGLTGFKGALFYYISELTYSTIFGIQAFMPNDYPLLVREYDDRIYPISAYYLAKICSFLPIFTIDGMILIFVSYFIIGLSSSFFVFLRTLITCILIEWNVTALGVAICATAPSYAIAITVTGPLLTIFSLTGGLFTNVAKMHAWIRWVQYFSWFRYGYESLIINQMSHSSFANISCMGRGTGKTLEIVPEAICESTGDQVIQNFSFDKSNFYFNWAALLYFTFIYYIVGYIGLIRRVKSIK